MIKVAVVDDHKLVLQAISNLLNSNNQKFKVETMCLSSIEFLQYLDIYPNTIDVALIDYSMPYLNGAHLSYLLNMRHCNIKKIGISSDDYQDYIDRFLLAGCNTFISKGCSPEELFLTIEQVYHNNGFYLNNHINKKTVKSISENKANLSFPKI